MFCYVSPIRTSAFVILAIVMTVVSHFAATHASDHRAWVGWFGVAFFGMGFVVIAKQLFNRAPVVSIDAQGITASRIRAEPFLWYQVQAVSIGKIRSTRFLCVWLKDEEGYVGTLPAKRAFLARANHAMGFPAIAVSFQGLTPGLDEAYGLIRTYVPERSVA
jgi:hypothetical protein